ncbi:SPOR domain-containing protein [Oribacterium sp. FC2011]|uniref:SPOR domain-containing protein n=1 Tax=Oribacterium sp. FC2011 TaxID=1408311 RepID=UPI0004E28AB4|nr:SPOR domain-containing protein [Oribacterium sp. FC2011]
MKKKLSRFLVSVGASAAVIMSMASCGGSNVPSANSDAAAGTTDKADEEGEAKQNEAGKNEAEKNEGGKSGESEAADEVLPDKSSETSETESSKAEMTDFFISKVAKDANVDTQEVRSFLVDDIDFDGEYEGFMFIGTEADKEYNSCEGEIWFVNEEGSKKLHDKFQYYLNDEGDVFSIVEGHDKNFVVFNDMYATSLVTNFYYTDGETCKESVVSGVGDAKVDEDTGDLVIQLSAYDCTCDFEKDSKEPMWLGHSWKPYYFYYSRNTGDFMEYGAKEINASELKDIVGTDVVKELEGDGYTVDNIIQRNNGIININYSKESKLNDGSRSINYMNATFDTRINDYIKAWDDDEADLYGSDFGGIYKVQLLGSGYESSAQNGSSAQNESSVMSENSAQTENSAQNESSVLPESPEDLYGVVVMTTKKSDKCLDTEMALNDADIYDEFMVYTPDFSGLNPESYYAVVAGLFKTREEAQESLKEVKAAGFKDAYIKNAGKYIGDKYLYTIYSTEGISVEDDYILLQGVNVSLPYPMECENTTMNLYVYKDAEFTKDGDLSTFTNYEKGETPYEWIKKNLELLETNPEAYSEGVPLHGVFKVAIKGDRITTYYSSAWWD